MTVPVQANRIQTAVVDEPLSVDRLLAAVSGPGVGGIALFVGMVRDVDGGRSVVSLDYRAHPSAAARLRAVAEEVASGYDVAAVAVEHRVGHLEIGDLAVVVAVGATHRGAALAACTRCIDEVKTQVPIWKAQRFGSGEVEWVGLPTG